VSSEPLAGRVAVVTGGAGGIGAAICKTLAKAGAAVAIGYNSSAEKAEAMLPGLFGDGHLALRMPVTDSAALADAIAAIDKRHSRLDLLVNSAGITRFVPHGDLDALDDGLISHILDVNVRGVIASARAALPLMRRGGGAIVNISSIAAVTAMGSNIAYCASKAAVDNLTKSLARALRRTSGSFRSHWALSTPSSCAGWIRHGATSSPAARRCAGLPRLRKSLALCSRRRPLLPSRREQSCQWMAVARWDDRFAAGQGWRRRKALLTASERREYSHESRRAKYVRRYRAGHAQGRRNRHWRPSRVPGSCR
jgi:NAD(P)-dependent dehydrogenase (short-subunit alcohol dehydrogenase family)